jgi:hypothetical protein
MLAVQLFPIRQRIDQVLGWNNLVRINVLAKHVDLSLMMSSIVQPFLVVNQKSWVGNLSGNGRSSNGAEAGNGRLASIRPGKLDWWSRCRLLLFNRPNVSDGPPRQAAQDALPQPGPSRKNISSSVCHPDVHL